MRIERPLPVDGQAARITELWAWTVIDPMTDTEGIVSAKLPGGGGVPLVTSMKSLVEAMGVLAEAAVRSAQEPRPVLQLRRFVPVEPDEEL